MENRRKPKMEDRKLRLLKKALKLYGVEDEKQGEFIKDLEELEKTPDDEVEDEKEVEEEKTEPKIEAEEPIEEKVDEVSEDKKEDLVEEEPISVDYEEKFKAQEEINSSLKAQIGKLTEMVSALGIPVEKEEESDTPFGNQKVSPIKREENDDDTFLRKRLGGR
jgi:hypothetical protein